MFTPCSLHQQRRSFEIHARTGRRISHIYLRRNDEGGERQWRGGVRGVPTDLARNWNQSLIGFDISWA